MTPAQKKYFEEYEKYKHIQIDVNGLYKTSDGRGTSYFVVSIDQDKELVKLRNKSDFIVDKTLHWCRKNLIPVMAT